MNDEPRYKHRPFLITGCGRSGTRYISDVLTAAKIPTGWEATLNAWQHPAHLARDYKWLLRKLSLCGDANWLATAYLKRIPPDVIVLHAVRHPLKVVRSMLFLRFFGDDYLRCRWQGTPSHVGVACSGLPGLRRWPTTIERCMVYWLGWNRLVERYREERGFPGWRYRLEDLADARRGIEILNKIIATVSTRPAVERVPFAKNVHRRFSRRDRELTWDDLPDGQLKEDVCNLARMYGYDV